MAKNTNAYAAKQLKEGRKSRGGKWEEVASEELSLVGYCDVYGCLSCSSSERLLELRQSHYHLPDPRLNEPESVRIDLEILLCGCARRSYSYSNRALLLALKSGSIARPIALQFPTLSNA